MKQVYHEAVCRYECDDVVTLKNGQGELFKIEEILLIQYVRANRMEFHFQLRNTHTGDMQEGLTPYYLMGDIVKYGNGKKPNNS